MNFIFIVPRKLSTNPSDLANEYMLSYAISDKKELEKSISTWALIAKCAVEEIEIVELYTPKKQYDAKRDAHGTFVSIHTRNQILQENEKYKREFIVNQSMNVLPLSQFSLLHRQTLVSSHLDDSNHRKLLSSKPLTTLSK